MPEPNLSLFSSLRKQHIFCLILFLITISCAKEATEPSDEKTDFCANIHRNDSISLSEQLKDVKSLMETKTGVYVLEDGAGSMISRAWLTSYAE